MSVPVGNINADFWLFDPAEGFDLTHPSSPEGPLAKPRLTLKTTAVPITICTENTALVVVDMQNFFLSPCLGHDPRGPAHRVQDRLVNETIPAAHKAGIQVVHLTWGLSDEDLEVLPPAVFRAFGPYDSVRYQAAETAVAAAAAAEEEAGSVPAGAVHKRRVDVGQDMGEVACPGSSATIAAGRKLMAGQWNTQLTEPLARLLRGRPEQQQQQQQKDAPGSETPAAADVQLSKDRMSGFWGGGAGLRNVGFLRGRGFATLLFAGVNTDQCVLGSLQDASAHGFDCVLLRDVCATSSPDYASRAAEFNCHRPLGFVSTSEELARAVEALFG